MAPPIPSSANAATADDLNQGDPGAFFLLFSFEEEADEDKDSISQTEKKTITKVRSHIVFFFRRREVNEDAKFY